MSKNTRGRLILILVLVIILVILFSIAFNMYSNRTKEKEIEVNDNGDIIYDSRYEILENSYIYNRELNLDLENKIALLIDGNINVHLSDISINKLGDSEFESMPGFCGVNSALTILNNANVYLKDSNILTGSIGAYGLTSLSEANSIYLDNSRITTTADNSVGLLLESGSIYLKSSNINTSGTDSIPLKIESNAKDAVLYNGSYMSVGTKSPSVYVCNTDLKAYGNLFSSKGSESFVVEGLDENDPIDITFESNEFLCDNYDLFLISGANVTLNLNDNEFTIKNKSKNETESEDEFEDETEDPEELENLDELYELDKNEMVYIPYLFKIVSDGYFNEDVYQSNVTINATNQDLEGDIYVSSSSSLELNLFDYSTYEGAINEENTGADIILNLDLTSRLKLTADTYVKELNNDAYYNWNIDFGDFKLYVDGISIN